MTLETGKNKRDETTERSVGGAGKRTPIKKAKSVRKKSASTRARKRTSSPGRAIERLSADSVLTTDATRAGRFLAAYSKVGVITDACRLSGTGRQSHYDRLVRSPEYGAAFTAAHEVAMDDLETEARRRGMHGVDQPVFHQGEIVGHIRKYSDLLLIFLLKHRRPEVFADKAIQLTGNVDMQTQDLTNIPSKRLEQMRKWITAARDAGKVIDVD